MVVNASERKSGILLPLSSLPCRYGIGSLGEESYEWIDLLAKTGVKIWQVLPLLPTGFGDSPYQASCGNAYNPYFIDLDELKEEGLLTEEELLLSFDADERRVNYGLLFERRIPLLKVAFSRFCGKQDFQRFKKEGEYRDFALFMALKEEHNFRPWMEWAEEYKNCEEGALRRFGTEKGEKIDFWEWTQFAFLKQWRRLKQYANAKGVSIMGDMPIYLSADSMECWKHRSLFQREGDAFSPVAGVPPDAFSSEGQLWGNPLYDYEKMKEDGYAWWRNRIKKALEIYDFVRIDHFRGFDRYYAIPLGKTAKEGEWKDGPKAELFYGLDRIVAEDLGLIDDGVRQLMAETGYAGMKVMSFGFNGDKDSEHKPYHYQENVYGYTGTHDNSPFCGYIEGMNEFERRAFQEELLYECKRMGVACMQGTPQKECLTAIKLLFHSKARVVVLPLHDLLCLGEEARINYPSKAEGNWTIRYRKEDFKEGAFEWLKALVKETNR